MFVLQSETYQHTARHQQLRIIALDCSHEEVNAAHPEQGLKRIHGEPSCTADNHRGEQHRYASEEYRESLAAKLNCDNPSKQNFRSIGERRKNADRVQRISEDCAAHSQNKCCQGRKINVTESQVFAGRNEVQFVAKVAVSVVGKHLEKHGDGSQNASDSRRTEPERLLCFLCQRVNHGGALLMRSRLLPCGGIQGCGSK